MRTAQCHCGELIAACPEQHLLHVECGCVACQRRTGTPSSFQVWYRASEVQLQGDYKTYQREGATGTTLSFNFCPNCGCTLLVELPLGEAIYEEKIVQVPVGCFFDQEFPAPDVAVWTQDLPHWFSAIPDKEAQMEQQGQSLEAVKDALRALGKL